MNKREETARQKAVLSCFRNSPDDLVFWSFRYFLGRRTIHTCAFAQELAKAWPFLNQHVRGLIKNELDHAFTADDAARATHSYKPLGDDCDRQAWEEVRQAYSKE